MTPAEAVRQAAELLGSRAEWVNPPVMCEGCRNERKTRYRQGTGDTIYSETQVFHGGSPGSGRRK